MVFIGESVVKELLQKRAQETKQKEKKNPTRSWFCCFLTKRASDIKESAPERSLLFIGVIFPGENHDILWWEGYTTPFLKVFLYLKPDRFQQSEHYDNQDGSSLSDCVRFSSESSQVKKRSLLARPATSTETHAGWSSVSWRQHFQHPYFSFLEWNTGEDSGDNWFASRLLFTSW